MDTYELTAPTQEQIDFLRKRFKVDRLDATTYNIELRVEDVDAFVEWADEQAITYRLI